MKVWKADKIYYKHIISEEKAFGVTKATFFTEKSLFMVESIFRVYMINTFWIFSIKDNPA